MRLLVLISNVVLLESGSASPPTFHKAFETIYFPNIANLFRSYDEKGHFFGTSEVGVIGQYWAGERSTLLNAVNVLAVSDNNSAFSELNTKLTSAFSNFRTVKSSWNYMAKSRIKFSSLVIGLTAFQVARERPNELIVWRENGSPEGGGYALNLIIKLLQMSFTQRDNAISLRNKVYDFQWTQKVSTFFNTDKGYQSVPVPGFSTTMIMLRALTEVHGKPENAEIMKTLFNDIARNTEALSDGRMKLYEQATASVAWRFVRNSRTTLGNLLEKYITKDQVPAGDMQAETLTKLQDRISKGITAAAARNIVCRFRATPLKTVAENIEKIIEWIASGAKQGDKTGPPVPRLKSCRAFKYSTGRDIVGRVEIAVAKTRVAVRHAEEAVASGKAAKDKQKNWGIFKARSSVKDPQPDHIEVNIAHEIAKKVLTAAKNALILPGEEAKKAAINAEDEAAEAGSAARKEEEKATESRIQISVKTLNEAFRKTQRQLNEGNEERFANIVQDFLRGSEALKNREVMKAVLKFAEGLLNKPKNDRNELASLFSESLNVVNLVGEGEKEENGENADVNFILKRLHSAMGGAQSQSAMEFKKLLEKLLEVSQSHHLIREPKHDGYWRKFALDSVYGDEVVKHILSIFVAADEKVQVFLTRFELGTDSEDAVAKLFDGAKEFISKSFRDGINEANEVILHEAGTTEISDSLKNVFDKRKGDLELLMDEIRSLISAMMVSSSKQGIDSNFNEIKKRLEEVPHTGAGRNGFHHLLNEVRESLTALSRKDLTKADSGVTKVMENAAETVVEQNKGPETTEPNSSQPPLSEGTNPVYSAANYAGQSNPLTAPDKRIASNHFPSARPASDGAQSAQSSAESAAQAELPPEVAGVDAHGKQEANTLRTQEIPQPSESNVAFTGSGTYRAVAQGGRSDPTRFKENEISKSEVESKATHSDLKSQTEETGAHAAVGGNKVGVNVLADSSRVVAEKLQAIGVTHGENHVSTDPPVLNEAVNTLHTESRRSSPGQADKATTEQQAALKALKEDPRIKTMKELNWNYWEKTSLDRMTKTKKDFDEAEKKANDLLRAISRENLIDELYKVVAEIGQLFLRNTNDPYVIGPIFTKRRTVLMETIELVLKELTKIEQHVETSKSNAIKLINGIPKRSEASYGFNHLISVISTWEKEIPSENTSSGKSNAQQPISKECASGLAKIVNEKSGSQNKLFLTWFFTPKKETNIVQFLEKTNPAQCKSACAKDLTIAINKFPTENAKCHDMLVNADSYLIFHIIEELIRRKQEYLNEAANDLARIPSTVTSTANDCKTPLYRIGLSIIEALKKEKTWGKPQGKGARLDVFEICQSAMGKLNLFVQSEFLNGEKRLAQTCTKSVGIALATFAGGLSLLVQPLTTLEGCDGLNKGVVSLWSEDLSVQGHAGLSSAQLNSNAIEPPAKREGLAQNMVVKDFANDQIAEEVKNQVAQILQGKKNKGE